MKKVFVYLLGIMVFFAVACSSEKTGDTETAAADSTGTDVAVAPTNFWEGEVVTLFMEKQELLLKLKLL
ncbi:MAG: hypothetical protein R3B93_19530 [Bacteroidia bacterium]